MPLAADVVVSLDRARANYLLNVLRLQLGDDVLVFNGYDGEWRASVAPTGRKAAELRVTDRTRPQPASPDLVYLFAPLKHARLDYLVQKAVEMGVGTLQPVITRRTVADRVNGDRMRANAVEAAEQCGILCLPAVRPPLDLPEAIASLGGERLLIFCDEEAAMANPIRALPSTGHPAELALLIGPEGGFDPAERSLVLARPNTVRISLGPRILRADTAAVAALAIVQARLGDWS